MATVNVKDSAGAVVPIEKPLPPGTAAAAASKPVTLSTEDKAKLDAIAVALGGAGPTGGATETTLAAINAKAPAKGTAAMADSTPVTLATDDTQIGAKTTASVLGVGGSGIIGWLSDAVTQTKALVELSPTLVSGRMPVDGSGVTQPVSIASWSGLTDTQLRASAVPVSATSLPLPSGAATSAAQTTGNASLSSIDGKLPASLGAKSGTGSVSVVHSTDSLSSNVSTTAYAASLVVKASAGSLWGISGYNSKASGQFLQVHDAASLPADTAVPKILLYVAASSPFAFDFGSRGRAFGAGIVVCNSSTGPTKTIGSADLWLDAQYS